MEYKMPLTTLECLYCLLLISVPLSFKIILGPFSFPKKNDCRFIRHLIIERKKERKNNTNERMIALEVHGKLILELRPIEHIYS